MSKNFSDDIARMQQLMSYGINEGAQKNGDTKNSIVEFHQKAADGKTYGIIKECNKYYIKVAPPKDTELVAEDYDYIGGYMNKKAFEYPSYTVASKNFDLKLKSINEAMGKDKAVISEQFKPAVEADWQVNETREMRAELNRFHQLNNNIDYILSENKDEKALQLGDARNVNCEGGNPFCVKPFSTDTINNMEETTTDPKKADTTYKEKGEYKEEVKGGEHSESESADDTYSKKVGKIESEGVAVATSKGASHKNEDGVKMNEGKKTFVLSEQQVLAWSKSKEFMDKSKGTEIGDSAPYTESPKENDLNEESIATGGNNMEQHVGEKGDSAPYTDKPADLEETEVGANGLPTNTPKNDSTILTDAEKENDKIYEITLNDFGKHPAYQKKPFTTPDNAEINKWGRDCDDDSVKGDKPFGTQIGDGNPFSEKVLDVLTDAVVSILKKKVK